MGDTTESQQEVGELRGDIEKADRTARQGMLLRNGLQVGGGKGEGGRDRDWGYRGLIRRHSGWQGMAAIAKLIAARRTQGDRARDWGCRKILRSAGQGTLLGDKLQVRGGVCRGGRSPEKVEDAMRSYLGKGLQRQWGGEQQGEGDVTYGWGVGKVEED